MLRLLIDGMRSYPPVRQFFRTARMSIVHRRHRFRHVDSSFFIAGEGKFADDLIAGPYSHVGRGCEFGPGVQLGRYVMMADYVTIIGSDHNFRVPGQPVIFSGRPAPIKTVIEDDVWVGYRATIIRGVRIGRGAVVAAAAVVTHDVEPYTIVGGVPAKPIGKRFLRPEDIARHDEMLARPATQGTYCS